jgi:hypothetical protein
MLLRQMMPAPQMPLEGKLENLEEIKEMAIQNQEQLKGQKQELEVGNFGKIPLTFGSSVKPKIHNFQFNKKPKGNEEQKEVEKTKGMAEVNMAQAAVAVKWGCISLCILLTIISAFTLLKVFEGNFM